MLRVRTMVVCAAVAGLAATACGTSQAATDSRTNTTSSAHTINGTYFLVSMAGDVGWSGATCYGTGGYSDVKNGLEVVVRDGNSKIVATSELANGGFWS